MDLSIIIVNWKVADLVSELLDSVVTHTDGIRYEIFVVDNASDDGIEDVIGNFRKAHQDIELVFIRNEKNLGFAAANNLAISQASGRIVVLLNPDTRLESNALRRMVEWMDYHPDVGIAGPRLLDPDGAVQPSVRRFPGLIDQAMILLKLHRLLPKAAPLKRYLARYFDYDREADVDQVMGAAFFVRSELFRSVGLLDEGFFLWFEEVDFCKRAKNAGWRIVYTPAAEIVHHGGSSFAKEMTLTKQRYFNESMERYFRKHRGALYALMLALPAALAIISAGLYSLLKRARKKE